MGLILLGTFGLVFGGLAYAAHRLHRIQKRERLAELQEAPDLAPEVEAPPKAFTDLITNGNIIELF